jgi:hypothetical protein
MSARFTAWLLVSTMTNERDERRDRDGFERALLAENRSMRLLTAPELVAVQWEALSP